MTALAIKVRGEGRAEGGSWVVGMRAFPDCEGEFRSSGHLQAQLYQPSAPLSPHLHLPACFLSPEPYPSSPALPTVVKFSTQVA